MNLNTYKSDAKFLMKLINKDTNWSKFAKLGKTRKEYTTFKIYLNSDNDVTTFKPINRFFNTNGCEFVMHGNKNQFITIKVKTNDLSKLAALYKIHTIK